jgi:hypothetical protein
MKTKAKTFMAKDLWQHATGGPMRPPIERGGGVDGGVAINAINPQRGKKYSIYTPTPPLLLLYI